MDVKIEASPLQRLLKTSCTISLFFLPIYSTSNVILGRRKFKKLMFSFDTQNSIKRRGKIVRQVFRDLHEGEASIFKRTLDLVTEKFFQCFCKL